MSLLDIKNLSVRFGDTTAVPVVDGLDLSVDKGEVLAIVGESGYRRRKKAPPKRGFLCDWCRIEESNPRPSHYE